MNNKSIKQTYKTAAERAVIQMKAINTLNNIPIVGVLFKPLKAWHLLDWPELKDTDHSPTEELTPKQD